ncbi:hypothetical protein [Dactylosporangium matsuzakiense]|uniref:Uncharacterized protein n=1 Tax=Dactylosporangium matsuzakiense TaxID=53360 RepID=A0A9W6KSX0_9ACTN|nr:hypothetical protein [Dactylosporangium matsuzakiense]UWZ46497.1 hypothetical protein Dmats_08775 [Dactylosporangium matsuzakiense]GLL06633.1 hypothetical protein GCM10017581_083830 [Dactylosporangium matsuzakiense]
MSYPIDPDEEEGRPRRDPWRALRKTVAQIVVVFTIPFVFAIGRAALGLNKLKVDRSPADWTVWGIGIALMVAASGLAIQALRGKAPAALGERAAWVAGGVWLLGLVFTIVYSQMVPPPVR